ncbi:hypothetical protein ACH4M4_24860 [Streptomyces sp. NPDC017254]
MTSPPVVSAPGPVPHTFRFADTPFDTYPPPATTPARGYGKASS